MPLPCPPPPSDLCAQFQQLDRLLLALRPYWQLRPFAELQLPWENNPDLQAFLARLSDEQLDRLEANMQSRTAALAPFIPEVDTLMALSQAQPLPLQRAPLQDAALSFGVPGRKWQQVTAFCATLPQESLPFLEWCAGKGHLGRVLHRVHGHPVTSLELQTELCHAGDRLTQRHGSNCRMQACDVLSDEVLQHLQPGQHAVALHACGQLHLQLLQQASRQQVQRVSLSPCCYHLIAADRYQPLSEHAQASPLRLSRHDLRLAVQETVTAGARERRHRDREFHWRLSFDLLQRILRGKNSYLNCPAVPRSLLGKRFRDFCAYMAQHKGLTLDPALDYDRFEREGLARTAIVSRIELVRHLFRRPLELWLVLDRALYLQQQGYRVTVGEFCDYRLTPRNLLILASRT
ncbi:methyltransferase [Aestuariirhabdus litorea]|uniref:Methyltransferase n=1 Tax=Aestuariirhabdus litorea TaxID=2528527 RepID=A0A3P3VHU6_9GAMM|nr:methyltransferase [Aestuariirhabdus litorea]RRJ82291.1 methyltransferase [Aestuariirhabdus litorea]RWW92457.1 methyltransferase [Endozoicomonadaceae bacterium GTF-13]